MKLLARVEDFFEITSHSIVILRFLSEDGRIRVNEQIQLRTPAGQVMNTYVAAIAHMKPLLSGPPPDPYVIGVSLPPEVKKQDVPFGTGIWDLRVVPPCPLW